MQTKIKALGVNQAIFDQSIDNIKIEIRNLRQYFDKKNQATGILRHKTGEGFGKINQSMATMTQRNRENLQILDTHRQEFLHENMGIFTNAFRKHYT